MIQILLWFHFFVYFFIFFLYKYIVLYLCTHKYILSKLDINAKVYVEVHIICKKSKQVEQYCLKVVRSILFFCNISLRKIYFFEIITQRKLLHTLQTLKTIMFKQSTKFKIIKAFQKQCWLIKNIFYFI